MVLNRFRIGGADVVSASEGEQHLAGRGAHGVVDLSLPLRLECGAGLGGLGSGHDASRGGVHGEVASVVDETTPNSVVVTAAHCAFDWAELPAVLADGRVVHGAEAFRAALSTGPGWLRAGAWLLGVWPVSALARVVYGWVAAHRHRFPGGTDACATPRPEPTA